MNNKTKAYNIISWIILILLAILFIFPIYWIITGSFKDAAAINSAVPQWFPKSPTMDNFIRLFKNPALRWMFNSVIIAVLSMGFTCITAAMAGYAIAKKRFVGQTLLFSLLICAMALPKQVVLVPLLKEMSFLNLHDTISVSYTHLDVYKRQGGGSSHGDPDGDADQDITQNAP